MKTNLHCPTCGQPLPADAPMGICPNCLVSAGFGTMSNEAAAERHRSFRPPSVEEIAPRFPQLEVLELLGSGGMGAVYKARQKRLDRVVALKILPPGIGGTGSFGSRFEREAKALAKLHHPQIVTLYEYGEADGLFYFLMEYVDGVTLRQLLGGGRIAPAEALAIVPQICDALQFAHDHGIVHRDIKPENILLNKEGQVKIADFGVAKIVAGPESDADAVGTNTVAAETQRGGVIGTPAYMAPEQIDRPADVDHRADIYALGVVLYELLTGEPPKDKFQPPSRKVQIDVRLDEIVLRALEREPAHRYSTAREFKATIESVAAAGRRTEPARAPAPWLPNGSPRLFSRLALGLFLAGILGTLMLMSLSPRHALALIFGAATLLLALLFGAMGWGERLGKAVTISVLTIILGTGIAFAALTQKLPWLADIKWRAAAAEQREKQPETQAIGRQEALPRENGAAAAGIPRSIRQRFEAREGMAARTSWTVMEKPSLLNPDGWAVMARMTIGGVAKIRFPDEAQRRCDIRLIGGNDDEITVRIDDLARNTTMTLSLLRDRPGEITLDGEGFRVRFPTEHVASIKQPDTTPFAPVIVTPVRREDSTKHSSTDPASPAARAKPDSAATDPRGVVDQWLGHVKANREEPMWDLTTREYGGAGSENLRNTLQFDRIKAYTLALASNSAMVVTTRFKDNAGHERRIAFSLVLRDGKWLIRDHWNVPAEVAESRLDGFVTGSGARFDVRRMDIVGRWHSEALSPASFEFREDGHFSTSYRTAGGRTTLAGSWTLDGDQLGYQTAGGGITGRVVNVREDFFQLQFSGGNLGGYHRAKEGDRPATGQEIPHLEPVQDHPQDE